MCPKLLCFFPFRWRFVSLRSAQAPHRVRRLFGDVKDSAGEEKQHPQQHKKKIYDDKMIDMIIMMHDAAETIIKLPLFQLYIIMMLIYYG